MMVCLTIPGVNGRCFGEAKQSAQANRLDPTKYTIYIVNLGKASESGDLLLQLHNNCSFRIRIPVACCEKKGEGIHEILPLFRVDKTTGKVDVPNLKKDVIDGHWLAPGESVEFRVPARYSRSEHWIYVPFDYEWEHDGYGPRSGVGEPEHYVLSVIGATTSSK